MSNPILSQLANSPAVAAVLGRQADSLTVAEHSWAATAATIVQELGANTALVVVPQISEAEQLTIELQAWLGTDRVQAFPDWETLPFERMSPSPVVMGQRVKVLHRLATDTPTVVVCSVKAAIQKLAGSHDWSPILISDSGSIDSASFSEKLVSFGYQRTGTVERPGEFSVRGSIIDVFPATAETPIRIDLWGDEIERLCEFSVSDQLSHTDVTEVEIFACREVRVTDEVIDRAEDLVYSQPWGAEHWNRFADGENFDGMESWLTWVSDETSSITAHLPADTCVIEVEPQRCAERAAQINAEEKDLATSLATSWEIDEPDLEDRYLHKTYAEMFAMPIKPRVQFSALSMGADAVKLESMPWTTPGEKLVEQIQRFAGNGQVLLASAATQAGCERMQRTLYNWGIDLPISDTALESTTKSAIVLEPLAQGFQVADSGVALLCEADLSGRKSRQLKKRRAAGKRISEDLAKGDLVVHYQHGVGRFAGVVTRTIGGFEGDYLLIEYAGDDKLYLPTDQIDFIRQFSSSDDAKLNKLGGADFARTKQRVASEVAKIAQELVVLYQKRVNSVGHSFAVDTPWQTEMEDAFEFRLTTDQASAVVDVKDDMESLRPMDRLVIGDVGFGKTEIAVRAVFKAVQGGKQAAVLVPTTLLAQQHYQTFTERLDGYPITIRVLSRFNTAADNRKIAKEVSSGDVDVLIGTHRLLSKDIRFKDLGLLVVDEEQRFGVSHKERIKEQTTDVDVLTLSATPIPRTLEMSLTGIRDLSVLNTPPIGRQPIATHVGAYDDRLVAEAIRRELLREGQVFFVHNRVRSIDHVTAQLSELVPEARIGVAHGQMDERQLEAIVTDFWEGNLDVLVCTTIIESGIDMPTVNTLIVDRAEKLGLSQMHQLRGRVGRSGQRAYAYLLTSPDASLSEHAYKRLKTIGESTELGAGFAIAMRDLEIRGAGNLLGTGQSGHIASVGYDLYCQLVTDAIEELKGNTVEPPEKLSIDLPIDASISTDYMAGESDRITSYRRLSEAESLEEVDQLRVELEDRFGAIPQETLALLDLARLRIVADQAGVTEITSRPGPGLGGAELFVSFVGLELPVSKQLKIVRLHKGTEYREPTPTRAAQLDLAVADSEALSELYKTLQPLIGIS